MTYKITKIKALEILDSRGNPTVEVEIQAEKNKLFFKTEKIKAWAQVPSGSSTGKFEAYELRDEDENRFFGKGVLKVVQNINNFLSKPLIGLDPTKQKEIDNILINLDGTPNKNKLGANAILAISMATARLGAIAKGIKLYEYISVLSNREYKIPRPFFNIINGGLHAGNKIAFQEFMIAPNFKNFNDNYRAGSEIYHSLKNILKIKYGGEATLLGDEGGFAPNEINSPEEAFDLINEAVEKAGYEGKVDYAIDVAATSFFQNGKYNLGFKSENHNLKTTDQLIDTYLNLVEKYPIISIEDPFDENDFQAFSKLKDKLKDKKVQIVGDDLTVTNPIRIKEAIKEKSCDSLLLKINQIGTISEAIDSFKLAKENNWFVMVSHRSCETNDDFISDFATGIGSEQIKSGAPARGERVAKYNRLLSIFLENK